MVAKSPRSLLRETAARMAMAPLSPTLMRDTVKKVDKCMARLQELQQIVAGPRTNTTYLQNGVRRKEQSFRTKAGIGQRSSPPPGKLPQNAEEWRLMSLPANLLGETMREIVQTSRFTRNVVEAMSKKHDPRTPPTERRQKMMMQHSELHSRRKREKHAFLRSSESDAQRAKSRIIFDSSSPRQICNNYIANRVSPRNRPWAKKTVLFPNPLFQPSSPKSPVVARKNRAIPHKLLIKSLPSAVSKLQVKIKSSEPDCLKSPKATNAAKLKRPFSPSSLAMRLVSPMGKSVQTMNAMSGLKQRPMSMSVHRRIQGRR